MPLEHREGLWWGWVLEDETRFASTGKEAIERSLYVARQGMRACAVRIACGDVAVLPTFKTHVVISSWNASYE